MSNTSRSRGHPSTLHAFFLAAQARGYTEFQLQLVANPSGRIEFCINPQDHAEISAKFEVRGNMVRGTAKDASSDAKDTDALINYGGTRSGEEDVEELPVRHWW